MRFSARQDNNNNNNEPQRPRPFSATQPQEFRGYLPPQPPPQPEFQVPTTSQFPSTPPAAAEVMNPFFQQQQQTGAPTDQTPLPPSVPSLESTQPPPAPAAAAVTDTESPVAQDFSTTPSSQQQQTTTTVGFTDEPAGFLVTNPPFESNSENLQTNLNDVFHPPHIHEMNVQCSKDMMTINVEFNKPYDGVIYSKASMTKEQIYFTTPETSFFFSIDLLF